MNQPRTGILSRSQPRRNHYSKRKLKTRAAGHPVYGFFFKVFKICKLIFTVCFGLAALAAFSFFLIIGYQQLVHSPYFQVKNVVIKNLNRVSEDEVLELTGLNKPANILAVKLRVMAENLKNHPWIKNVSLTRKMPDTIIVEIEERRPKALIRLGDIYYLDESGVPFYKVDAQDKTALPVITGFSKSDFVSRPGSARRELENVFMCLDVLSQRNDRFRLENIAEVNVDPVRGITLFTRGQKLEVKVGFGEYKVKFKRFGRVLAYLKVKGDDRDMVYVNLECGPRVIIRRNLKS